MKDPFRIATTSSAFGLAAAISLAIIAASSAIGNRQFVIENLDFSVAAHELASWEEALSPDTAKFTSAS